MMLLKADRAEDNIAIRPGVVDGNGKDLVGKAEIVRLDITRHHHTNRLRPTRVSHFLKMAVKAAPECHGDDWLAYEAYKSSAV